MALSHSPQIVRDGLVLYLDAANTKSYPGTGTTWFDLRGQSNGNIINGVLFDSFNQGSFSFDGIDDYINLGDIAILNNTLNGNTNWTICYWCNPLNEGRILDRGNLGQDPNASMELLTRSIYSNNVTGTDTFSILDINIVNAGWSYVCITRTNLLFLSWYLNGNSRNSTQMVNSFSGSGIWKIGRRALNNTGIYSGKIASLKIYNKVLTSQEIKQNFEALRGRYGI